MFVNSDKNEDRESVIDENLKKVFNETLEEGIPDRFKDLLSKLKQQESQSGSDNG
ncbi:NepR family anti-sigma factor [Sulfitobacter alexandrii]|uniref:NepR family anti-sigma factor n=1 Tax=Sulfitobacter alexandrii TaxID=1917485 RepID=UPI00155FACBA|nr:NepR family anti-sigma factor [Sulfitobacter alexandrii]